MYMMTNVSYFGITR